MELDFDPSKSEKNRQERGFGFAFAALIFDGRIEVSTARVETGETRIKAVGEIDGTCYVVIFTDRGKIRRIISARRANRKEARAWHASA